VKEAIEAFKLNVEAFPESGNVYDSLGEAYLADGNKELAIKYYKKSVEIDPSNTNGARILNELQNE
jgi:tetratricopeptide (TPR) repeat protein